MNLAVIALILAHGNASLPYLFEEQCLDVVHNGINWNWMELVLS